MSMNRDPESIWNAILGFCRIKTQTGGEWIYKISRDVNNKSGEKLFTVSDKAEELKGSQYRNQREDLKANSERTLISNKRHSYFV